MTEGWAIRASIAGAPPPALLLPAKCTCFLHEGLLNLPGTSVGLCSSLSGADSQVIRPVPYVHAMHVFARECCMIYMLVMCLDNRYS